MLMCFTKNLSAPHVFHEETGCSSCKERERSLCVSRGSCVKKLRFFRRGLRWRCFSFFLRCLNFGSLRPLPKTDLEKNKTAATSDEKSHGLGYTARIMRKKNKSKNKMAYFRRFWVRPLWSPKSLPILTSSNFFPEKGFQ